MEKKLRCYRIYFDDDSAVLIDAWSEVAAIEIAKERIASGQYNGQVKSAMCLDD